MDEAEAHKQGLNDQLKAYQKLKKINSSVEFNDFFDLIIKTASDKMIWAFTGDNIKTMDDFYKVRGEVISYLYPIQEIKGADAMSKQLTQQLNEYYNQTV